MTLQRHGDPQAQEVIEKHRAWTEGEGRAWRVQMRGLACHVVEFVVVPLPPGHARRGYTVRSAYEASFTFVMCRLFSSPSEEELIAHGGWILSDLWVARSCKH